MDGNSFFSFDFLLSQINPLLSWALHASFYAKRHIKEEQRMGRALRMRDEGRKLLCQDQHSARPASPSLPFRSFRGTGGSSSHSRPIFIPLPSGASDAQYCQILNERNTVKNRQGWQKDRAAIWRLLNYCSHRLHQRQTNTHFIYLRKNAIHMLIR